MHTRTSRGYHHDLGRSWNIQGYLDDESRRNLTAIPAFERAIAEQSARDRPVPRT